MNQLPYFRLYAAELLADEHTGEFTPEELGAWLRLVCYAWLSGSIPADPQRLARLARVPSDRFEQTIWPIIADRFIPLKGNSNRLTSRRLEDERTNAQQARDDKIKAGQASGRIRREQRSNSVPVPGEQRSNAAREQPNPTSQPASLPSSLPSSLPTSQPASPGQANGGAPRESRLAGFRKKLGEELQLGHAIALGKDGAAADFFEHELTHCSESALIADCCELAKRSNTGTPTSLAWFVPWLKRLPEAKV